MLDPKLEPYNEFLFHLLDHIAKNSDSNTNILRYAHIKPVLRPDGNDDKIKYQFMVIFSDNKHMWEEFDDRETLELFLSAWNQFVDMGGSGFEFDKLLVEPDPVRPPEPSDSIVWNFGKGTPDDVIKKMEAAWARQDAEANAVAV